MGIKGQISDVTIRSFFIYEILQVSVCQAAGLHKGLYTLKVSSMAGAELLKQRTKTSTKPELWIKIPNGLGYEL